MPFQKGQTYPNTGRTRFKKGNVSWNKGKHIRMNTGRTHFKKGHQMNQGSNNPMWKGGKAKGGEGYIHILKPEHPFAPKSGYVLEHRLVMEKHLGRYLLPTEQIHHINRIKSDNRIKNLMLFRDAMAHKKYHLIQEGVKSGEILFDGCHVNLGNPQS